MKNPQPALSICIPTFNRLHYLKESLDTLLPQAQRLDVEVCISDNHSTDGTVGYLKEMVELYSCLSICVQKENVGLDKNMLAVIEMASGNYICQIGDDDYLPEGAVNLILNELEEGSDVIILDGWHTDAALLEKRRHLPPDIQGVTMSLPAEAFYCLWDKMPFGSFVADRKCFLSDCSGRYIGTSHAYTGAVWDALAEKYHKTGTCKVKCMATPTVLLRGGEKSWRNDAAKIMLYEIPLWFQLVMVNDVYKSVVAPILNKYIHSQTSLVQLLSYRALGQLDKQMLDSLAGIYPDRQIELMRKIVALPVKPLEWSLAGYFGVKRFIKWIVRR